MTSFVFTDLAWNSAREIIVPFGDAFVISDEVRDEGLILMYIRLEGGNGAWIPVPNPFVAGGLSIGAEIQTTAIVLALRNADGTPVPPGEPVTDLDAFRVIAVPPGTVLTANIVPNDLVGMSYDDVTAALGIRE